jgi:hypothetical protein
LSKIHHPSLTFPILETLKEDKELYVRKSVANHLNDISREHPAFVLNVIKNWKGKSQHTDWILKHGSRTLLKKGNTDVLKHFGIKHNDAIELHQFKIHTPKVKTGEELRFSFSLKNKGTKNVTTRLEYAMYFRIANGTLSKKVFKISERELPKQSIHAIEKKHSFKLITTRKYHAGKQQLALIINGKESQPLDFTLL